MTGLVWQVAQKKRGHPLARYFAIGILLASNEILLLSVTAAVPGMRPSPSEPHFSPCYYGTVNATKFLSQKVPPQALSRHQPR
jgi:hypothetical protein